MFRTAEEIFKVEPYITSLLNHPVNLIYYVQSQRAIALKLRFAVHLVGGGFMREELVHLRVVINVHGFCAAEKCFDIDQYTVVLLPLVILLLPLVILVLTIHAGITDSSNSTEFLLLSKIRVHNSITALALLFVSRKHEDSFDLNGHA